MSILKKRFKDGKNVFREAPTPQAEKEPGGGRSGRQDAAVSSVLSVAGDETSAPPSADSADGEKRGGGGSFAAKNGTPGALLTKVYSLRVLLIGLACILAFFIVLSFFRRGKVVREEAKSPAQAARLFLQLLEENDRSGMEKLWEDGELPDETSFEMWKRLFDGPTLLSNHVVLTREDGRMFLLTFCLDEHSRKQLYKLRSIREIPTTLRSWFAEKADRSVDAALEDLLKQQTPNETSAVPPNEEAVRAEKETSSAASVRSGGSVEENGQSSSKSAQSRASTGGLSDQDQPRASTKESK